MWFGGRGKAARPRTRKRQEERFVSDILVCPLGDIVDLSGSGVRLRCKGRGKFAVGQVLALPIGVPEGHLTLRARVVRIERFGFRATEVGLEFVGITPATARALKCLARFGFVSPVDRSAAGGAYDGGGGASKAAAPAAAEAAINRAREVLQVGASASAEEIKLAYRKLALTRHPDMKPGPNADQQFAEIVNAYNTLRNAVRSVAAGH